jgi:hypothetical protein
LSTTLQYIEANAGQDINETQEAKQDTDDQNKRRQPWKGGYNKQQ